MKVNLHGINHEVSKKSPSDFKQNCKAVQISVAKTSGFIKVKFPFHTDTGFD